LFPEKPPKFMTKTENLSFIIKIILYFLGFISILFTFLPFLKLDNWWIRIGDFPRLQIAVVCLIVLIPFFAFYRSFAVYDLIFAGLLLFSAVYHFYCILPYTPIYPKQVELSQNPNPQKTVKLLISNVLIENEDYGKLLNLVEEISPDIILLAEPDQKWLTEISSLKKNYPYSIEKPLDNAYGMALYSRFELIDPQLKFLIEENIPSIHTDIKLPSGDLIKLYCLHPRPPFPTESKDTTERDAELIIVGKEIEKNNKPAIIAGDLNDVAWSRTTNLFQKISEMLDPRIGRGLYSSFHADHSFVRFPLDHVFHSNHFRLVDLKRLPSIGSDHFPIYIALSYEPTAKFTQETPQADKEEKKEANEMINEAVEEKKEGN
jgi:endonuclease/exonuclease/phosphatase (EEP) superfamily protein YafD